MLIDYYPNVISQIREIKAICDTEQPEFDQLEQEINQVLLNMFISATNEYGIKRFEHELGIIPPSGQSLEDRRIAVRIRSSKKNLSLENLCSLLYNYSLTLKLKADYQNDELEVMVSDEIENLKAIYTTLDNLLSLQVFIYLSLEIFTVTKFKETVKTLELETSFNSLSVDWQQKGEIDLEVTTEIKETFEDVSVKICKNPWCLDGSVLLDGSKLLNAEIREEKL